jgi:hypothetical protein
MDNSLYAKKRKPKIIGVSAKVNFAKYRNLKNIPARIDTGARTSSLWATDVKIIGDTVKFKMFGPSSPYYTGKVVTMPLVGKRIVTSSTGHEQDRYLVMFPIKIAERRLRAKFTLSDRSTQSYPVLIGRNTLRGNFLVDSADPGDVAIYKDSDEAGEYNESEAV